MNPLWILGLASFASMASMRACDALLPRLAAEFAVSTGRAAHTISAFAMAYERRQEALARGVLHARHSLCCGGLAGVGAARRQPRPLGLAAPQGGFVAQCAQVAKVPWARVVLSVVTIEGAFALSARWFIQRLGEGGLVVFDSPVRHLPPRA